MCLGCGVGLCPGRRGLCSQNRGAPEPSCSISHLTDLGTEAWSWTQGLTAITIGLWLEFQERCLKEPWAWRQCLVQISVLPPLSCVSLGKPVPALSFHPLITFRMRMTMVSLSSSSGDERQM